MSGEPVTVLSSLNDDERQAYLDFLVASDVRFVKDSDGSYVARVGDGGGGGGNNTSSAAQSHLSSLPEGLAEAFGDGGSDPSLSRRTALLAYNRFLKFSQHLDVAYASKAKLRPVSRLIKLIDEIYQARRAFEMAELNSEGEKTGAYGVLSHRIPVFCFQFLKSKFGIKALVHQSAWELLLNIQRYRETYVQVDIFARFLSEFYSADDILFFLYVRSTVDSAIKKIPRSQRRHAQAPPATSGSASAASRKATTAVLLPENVALTVTKTVFRDHPVVLFNKFVELVADHLQHQPGQDKRFIDQHEFLFLAIDHHHGTQPLEDKDVDLVDMYISRVDRSLQQDEEAAVRAARQRQSGGPLAASTPMGARAPVRTTTPGPPLPPQAPVARPVVEDDDIQPDEKEYFWEELTTAVQQALDKYVAVLMHAAAEQVGPENVDAQTLSGVRVEVRRRLGVAMRSLLAKYRTYRPSTPLYEQTTTFAQRYEEELRKRFFAVRRVMVDTMRGKPPPPDLAESVDILCRHMIGTPDIRHVVEPMVAFFVAGAAGGKAAPNGDAPERHGIKPHQFLEPETEAALAEGVSPAADDDNGANAVE